MNAHDAFAWCLADMFTRITGAVFCVFMLRVYSPILLLVSLAVRLYYARRVVHPWKYQRCACTFYFFARFVLNAHDASIIIKV